MKYAIVNNERVEAQKGMKGFCPVCKKPVIARCGEFKVNHWAHAKSVHCDKWWEAETEWHRAWKDLFPKEWQEIIAHDESGEKHIADIKTDKGLVIEFQHSHIKPEEQTSREEFYKNMIWIVDGTRLKRDFDRFFKAVKHQQIKYINNGKNVFTIFSPEKYLPNNWLNRKVPVFFDFVGTKDWTEDSQEELMIRKMLWCILPSDRITLNYYSDKLPIIMMCDKENVILPIKEHGIIYIDYQAISKKIKQFLHIS